MKNVKAWKFEENHLDFQTSILEKFNTTFLIIHERDVFYVTGIILSILVLSSSEQQKKP